MLTAAKTGMADALGITERDLMFLYPQYTKIAEELVEDVLRTGNYNPAFKGRARQIELAYQQGDLGWLSVQGAQLDSISGGFGFAPAQAPAKVYPSAQAPAAPSKSLPLPVDSPRSVPRAPAHP